MWQGIVDNLKSIQDKASEEARAARNEEAQRKSGLRTGALDFAYAAKMEDQVNTSRVLAMSILKDRSMTPRMQF